MDLVEIIFLAFTGLAAVCWLVSARAKKLRGRSEDDQGVTFVIGEQGGGKTVYMMEKICHQLGMGGTVLTNIELKIDNVKALLKKRYKREFDPEQYVFLDREGTVGFVDHVKKGKKGVQWPMVAIDEAALDMDSYDISRQMKDDLIRKTLRFYQTRRHYRCNIIWATPDFGFLAARLRKIVRVVIKCWNPAGEDFPFVLRWLGIFPIFLRARYNSKLAIKGWPWADKKDWEVMNCYDTYQEFEEFGGDEVKDFGKTEEITEWPMALKLVLIVWLGLLSFKLYKLPPAMTVEEVSTVVGGALDKYEFKVKGGPAAPAADAALAPPEPEQNVVDFEHFDGLAITEDNPRVRLDGVWWGVGMRSAWGRCMAVSEARVFFFDRVTGRSRTVYNLSGEPVIIEDRVVKRK